MLNEGFLIFLIIPENHNAMSQCQKNSKVIYKDMKLTKDEKLPADLSNLENFLQRLWACLTVKQLLEKE